MLQTDWPNLAGRLFGMVRRRWQLAVRRVRLSWYRARRRSRADWLKLLRRERRLIGHRVGEWARRVDIRKPTHAVVIGVVIAGIAAPVLSWMADNERYRLNGEAASVITKVAPHLKEKLKYEQPKQQLVFNADGQDQVAKAAKDVLTTRVGGAEKKTTQLYTATFPNDSSGGIMVNDNVNKVPVTFKPLFGVMGGRDVDGHVVYPLKNQDGQVVYTPKANALKEDIVLNSAPADMMDYQYQLGMPDYIQPRIEADGAIGFYSADPMLFGNITFGTDKDRADIDKARAKAAKTYQMFKIPAPVIVQAGGAKGTVSGRFSLDGKVLTLHVVNLKSANYPLSIDPTFYVASTADFLLGSSDDNVDLSVANQVGRGVLTGGSLAAWSQNQCAGANTNLPINNFSFGLTAYNGYLYMLGGGNTASAAVYYADINLTTGAIGCTTAWTALTSFNTARVGTQAFGYNGYLYVVGGEDSTGATIYQSTEYAKLTSTGTIATDSGCGAAWCTSTNLNTGRAFFATALYQGVVYVFGGSASDSPNINATLTNTVEYSRINGDGSLGTWTTTTALVDGAGSAQARDRFGAAAFNGYVYVMGGQTSTTTLTNLVQYAPIKSDGTLGNWVTSTAFPTARRDFGYATERGHIYIYGGCTIALASGTGCSTSGFLGDTQYAVINADGTIGQWQQTQNTAAKRGSTDSMATTFYNGHLYSAGGCGKETTGSNNCQNAGRTNFLGYTSVNTPGSFDGLSALSNTPFNPTASSVARYGGQAAALNGYVYYVSGCTTTGGTAYTPNVDYAKINADGTLAAWSTTTALPAQSGDFAGRMGHTVVAYGNKLYVIAGEELPNPLAANDVFLTSVLSNTQNTNGTLSGTWTAEASLPATTAFHTSVVWNNYVYVIGGLSSNAANAQKNKVYYSKIGTNGTLGAWTTSANNIGTAVWAHSSVIYGNYVYLFSGSTNTAGTLTTTVQIGTVQSSGDISGWTTTTAIGTAVMYSRAVIHNNFVYVMGGSVAGTTQSLIQWASITPGTGAIGTWSSTGIGANAFNGTNGLSIARSHAAAVAVDGYIYVLGGCRTTSSVTIYDNCSTIMTATTTTETEVYQPNNGGTGQTGAWSTTGVTALPTAKADAAGVAYNGYIYSIGGCTGYTAGACTGSGQYSTEIKYAPINPDGTVGTWASTTAQLGTGTMLLKAAAYNGFMYILGGQTSATAAVTTVLYGAIGSTGDIASLSTSSNPLGTARRNFGAAILNGYIYALGGENASGTKLSSTEYAPLNSDGTVGTWSSSTSLATTNQATTARSGMGVVAYGGNIYVVGGNDSAGNNLQDIQYAPLNSSTGAIGTWANTIAMPQNAVARQTYAANGYMYFLGNEATGTEVSYAAISSSGVLGTLHDQPNAMAGAHAHGAVAYYNGIMYELGGCTLSGTTCNTVSSTNEKAGQLAISRAAHYSKLWDTQGVDTAPSQIVLNGTLQGEGSAVASIIRTASTFSTTLGVPQVINPVIFNTYYRIFPLNSSGTNIGVAKTYALYLKLDDTQEAAFPDVTTSQTAVTSITLYYHANPSRRLRHGASFSNVGCNITPANGCILDTAP